MAWREIIGRVCVVFKGHTLFDCLEMTKSQLLGLYWESFRQEARMRLSGINDLRLAKGGEKAEDVINSIERQAYPYEPEEEREATEEDFKELRNVFLLLEAKRDA